MIVIVSLATDDLSSVDNWFIQTWEGGQEKENYPGSLLLMNNSRQLRLSLNNYNLQKIKTLGPARSLQG